MSKEFELNYAGVGELLKSSEMQQICQEEASKLLSSSDGGYYTQSKTGSSRVRVEIRSDSMKTYNKNKKNDEWRRFK